MKKKPEPKKSQEEKERHELLKFLETRMDGIRQGLKIEFQGADNAITEGVIYSMIKLVDQVKDIHSDLFLDGYSPGEVMKEIRERAASPKA